jgi:hypothetical protein
MAKRAAAGATSMPVWSDEETGSPLYAADRIPISRRRNPQAVVLRYDLRRVTAIAFSVLVALSFVSYAAYAHQWSELSALRHLGKASPANELNGHPG